jgi:hypothetical protein
MKFGLGPDQEHAGDAELRPAADACATPKAAPSASQANFLRSVAIGATRCRTKSRSRFNLVINLKTAKASGRMPASVRETRRCQHTGHSLGFTGTLRASSASSLLRRGVAARVLGGLDFCAARVSWATFLLQRGAFPRRA